MRRIFYVLALSAAAAFGLPAATDLTAQAGGQTDAPLQAGDAAGAASDLALSPEQQA